MTDEYLLDPTWRAAGRQDVRALLARLEDDEARKEVDEALFHQGDRYPASAAAIPQLLAALESGSDAVRTWVLELLPCLAFGFFDMYFPRRDNDDGDEWLAWSEPTHRWSRECWLRVGDALPVIAPLVQAPIERQALGAIRLLTFYPLRDEHRALLRDVDPKRAVRRACSLVARAHHGERDVKDEAESLVGHKDFLVAAHAAVATALCGSPSEAARERLRVAAARSDYPYSPFTHTLEVLAQRALRL